MLCAVTSRRTQRRVSVGYSTCSVSIGSVLQNYWRTDVGTEKYCYLVTVGQSYTCLKVGIELIFYLYN